MSLVYAGVLSHAPGITGRADLVENVAKRDEFYANLDAQRQQIEDAGTEALIVIAAEHFGNFFMNNMPAYCMGIGETYEGPIEDPEWIKIAKTKVPGAPDLGTRLVREVMKTVDTAFAEEWKFDHGIMVPLNFLTPKYDLPICDSVPEKIAVVGTGGISHWPATPDSGKINEEWDRDFLNRLMRNDKDALLDYSDEDTYRDAGQGGFEIRTFIAIAAAAGGKGDLQFYTAELPIFAVGCTVASFDLAA
jgi:2,3-dihydroxyphenylpropionate 1,2-dioxygenase